MSRLDPLIRDVETMLTEARLDRQVAIEDVHRLEAAQAALLGKRQPTRQRSAAAGTVDPRRAAGAKAIGQVADLLAKVGRTTQAEIAKETGLNSGTVSHALTVLSAEGKATRTERRHNGSAEWSWVGEAPPRRNRVRAVKDEAA